MTATPRFPIFLVFDCIPGPDGARFIEAEDAHGRSQNVGTWAPYRNGLAALRIDAPAAEEIQVFDPTPRDAVAALESTLALLDKATAGTWQLWTSCSWRRIASTDGKSVLVPCVDRDGHPNMECGPDYVNAEAAIAAVNFLREHGRALLDRRAPAAAGDGAVYSTGRLLHTRSVQRWTEAQRQAAEVEESRRVFAGFSALDEGRSRRLVAVCETPEDARMIVAALNRPTPEPAEATAGRVPEGFVLVPVEPPFPKQYIATGKRTVNGETTTVYLYFSEEGGGWYQWSERKLNAKHFTTEKAALDAARGAPGPWCYMPAKSTIAAEPVEHPKAKQYRAMLAARPDAQEAARHA